MKTHRGKARYGLVVGGNWIIDQVKLIDVYPQPGRLANIAAQSRGTGGAPYNVSIGLANTGVPFPLFAAGLVGKDFLGEVIREDCRAHGIDVRHLETTNKAPTSYRDVMTDIKGERRTFFYARGANALWRGDGLDFEAIRARIFHLGSLLLLDALDQPDNVFGTRAARLLASAQKAGLKTSVDFVSEGGDHFAQVVTPALKFVDYCIMNEIEAGKTTGFNIRLPDESLDAVALRHAAGALLQKGVRELVVIHFAEGAFGRTRKGEDIWQSSINLPESYIKGTTGAGDAFCGGVLMGLHEGWDLPRCLHTGMCIAAASLADVTSTNGIKGLRNSLALAKRYGFGQPKILQES